LNLTENLNILWGVCRQFGFCDIFAAPLLLFSVVLVNSMRYRVLLVSLLLSAQSAAGADAAGTARSADVPVVPAQVKAVGNGFETDGVVQPVKQSSIAAQTSGRVITLPVKAGDKVRAGQVLATVDDSETQTGVQRSQAQVAQAQAELRNAQATFDRTRDLLAKGFVSAAAMDTADAQLRGAQAGRDQANAAQKQSGLTQGFTRVTAPFDAVVWQTSAEVGDLAFPGKALLTLYAPMPLRVVVQIPVSRSAQLRQDAAIEIAVPGKNGEPRWIRPSQITRLPTADPVAQTVEWRLDLPPAEAASLLPGQPVKTRFAAGQSQRLVIPNSAVLRRGELTAVYVVSGKGFALKAIRIGTEHPGQGVEVLAGLTESDQVALDPIRAGLAGAQPLLH
jgi:RND family efflux transporter MFP subunit